MNELSKKRNPLLGRTALGLSILALGGLFGGGCGGGDDQSTGDGSTGAATADSAAVTLFNSSGCAGCHTFSPADASGPVGPNLDQTTLSTQEIAAQISTGGGGMPPYEGDLSAAEIDSLAELISSSN